eukprot:jgi/Ulvmu1/2061/UM121_0002.1
MPSRLKLASCGVVAKLARGGPGCHRLSSDAAVASRVHGARAVRSSDSPVATPVSPATRKPPPPHTLRVHGARADPRWPSPSSRKNTPPPAVAARRPSRGGFRQKGGGAPSQTALR